MTGEEPNPEPRPAAPRTWVGRLVDGLFEHQGVVFAVAAAVVIVLTLVYGL